ncbi:MAG: hypothetical protein V2I51_17240, partial [Anderseniella sp.]|nr:hypothetical protein [Anderseniella sp.]
MKDQAADRVGREIENAAKDAIGEEAAKALGEEGPGRSRTWAGNCCKACSAGRSPRRNQNRRSSD